jgi:hypothetical protein
LEGGAPRRREVVDRQPMFEKMEADQQRAKERMDSQLQEGARELNAAVVQPREIPSDIDSGLDAFKARHREIDERHRQAVGPPESEPPPATEPLVMEPAPVRPADEYAKQLDVVLRREAFEMTDALKWLAEADSQGAASKDQRKAIARAIRDVAFDDLVSASDQEIAVEGLVNWGGKYSVPILIDLLDSRGAFVRQKCYELLGQLADSRAIEPVVKRMVNEFAEQRDAAACLAAIGAPAEDAVLARLDVDDLRNVRNMVKLLGQIGSQKSIKAFAGLSGSRRYAFIRSDVEAAIAQIRQRHN